MSDRTIKPCPFCGRAAELKHRMGSMGSWGYSYDFAEIEDTDGKQIDDTVVRKEIENYFLNHLQKDSLIDIAN